MPNAIVVEDRYVASVRDDVYTAYIRTSGGEYGGSYTVTPSGTTQTLETKNKYMLDDVTVNAIPSNYGLVERIGMELRIS